MGHEATIKLARHMVRIGADPYDFAGALSPRNVRRLVRPVAEKQTAAEVDAIVARPKVPPKAHPTRPPVKVLVQHPRRGRARREPAARFFGLPPRAFTGCQSPRAIARRAKKAADRAIVEPWEG